LASVSTVASAHHSAAQFDFAQTVRIEGVVKEMRVANPVHTGDTIGIDIAPMRTGEDGGYVKTFVLKDGTEF
jgi:hypothetical protein